MLYDKLSLSPTPSCPERIYSLIVMTHHDWRVVLVAHHDWLKDLLEAKKLWKSMSQPKACGTMSGMPRMVMRVVLRVVCDKGNAVYGMVL